MGHFRVLLEYCKNYGETGVHGTMTSTGVNGSRS